MTTSKRAYEDIDPDYAEGCEQKTKRQKELEQDAKQAVTKRVRGILKNEFWKEINNRESELHQVDRRLNEARLMMDRLRACIVSTYYGQINQVGSSEISRMNGPPSSIHPAVKKHVGKRLSHYHSDTSSCQLLSSSKHEQSINDDYSSSLHQRGDSIKMEQIKTLEISSVAYQSVTSAPDPSTQSVTISLVPQCEATFNDRRARLKIKKKIIIGNVSKYIPVDHREANDKSSHKWMVYVRGPKTEPDISGYVKKVWFFLHHSYKPNDLVEISSPPFHLTRRGWGEFPVRVQLHFVDPRNKKVDIIHQLKLDKTFSGLQTLGAETTVELDLEKDFFESESSNSRSSSTLSSYHQDKLTSGSVLLSATSVSEKLFYSQNEKMLLPEQFEEEVLKEPVANNSFPNNTYVTSLLKNAISDSYITEDKDILYSASDAEREADSLDKSAQSLEEYHMTIVHDTENNSTLEEKLEVNTDDPVSDKFKVLPVTSKLNSFMIPCSHTGLSEIVQEAPSSAILSARAALTILNPQLINTKNVNTLNKNNTTSSTQPKQQLPISVTSNLVTSKAVVTLSVSNVKDNVSLSSSHKNLLDSAPVNSPQQSSASGSTQSSSLILVDSNGYSVTLTPPLQAANVKQFSQAILPSLPSSLSMPLPVLPISSSAQVVMNPITVSEQFSPQFSLSLTQPVTVTASTISGNASCNLGIAAMSPAQYGNHQVQENQSSCSPSDVKKVIIVKPNLSGDALKTACTKTSESDHQLLPQLKQSRPRQVSLLTGKVFTPQTPPLVISKVSSPAARESLLVSNNTVTQQTSNIATSFGKSVSQVTKPGTQVLLLKNVNHATSVSSSTDRWLIQPQIPAKQITNLSSLVKQGQASQVVGVSIVNLEGSADKSALPVTLLNNSVNVNNQHIQGRQPSQSGNSSNIIMHIPGPSQSQVLNGQDASTHPKMSAIGITKHGKHSAAPPTLRTNLKSTTDEERRRNQYEVLLAWKRNRHLNEQGKLGVKVFRDRIEGEADVIPELNLADYTSIGGLLKEAVKLHPLIQANVNKLTHPYCAESLEQWITWTMGKKLGSEWHRACFVLKYLKTLLSTSDCFKGEPLMTTRQLVRWCRLHAFSPLAEAALVKPGTVKGGKQEDPNTPNSCVHIPSFTLAQSLDVLMSSKAAANAVNDDNVKELNVVDVGDKETAIVKQETGRVNDLGSTDILEWLPTSDGAMFVSDELRKRGLKLQSCQVEPGVMAHATADMLYKAMEEFLSDVLRETVAVSNENSLNSSFGEVTRRDVHKALTQLPEAAFCCNKFLGKVDVGIDSSGR